jgi:HAD superfamily hydrolase (TIGR01509 family)
VRWGDARHELLPLYRSHGVPEPFLEAHEGALNLYGAVAASGLLPPAQGSATQRLASCILERFEAEAIPKTVVLPVAVKFVRRLPALGLRAGIVSSNALTVISAILAREGLATAFDAIVARDDVTLLKPSPQGLLRCCAAMGVTPERCIYVGDSATDIEAARAASMTGFGVRAGMSSDSELLAAGAEAVVDDLGELLPRLSCSRRNRSER